MGDISEMRGLVTAVTFLGVLTLLLMWIPTELYTAGESRLVYTPEVFETIDVYNFAETKTIQFNETGGVYWLVDNTFFQADIGIGNWDTDFYYKIANETGLTTRLLHRWVEWFILPASHNLNFLDSQGVSRSDANGYLTVESIQNNAEAANNGSSAWRAFCDHFTYHVTFGFNNTIYNNFTHAWNDQEVYVFFGVDFTHVNTSYNAFQLMAMLLFFQIPTMNVYVNALLAIPIWACIAYLCFIFILRTIGAIFGGGA